MIPVSEAQPVQARIEMVPVREVLQTKVAFPGFVSSPVQLIAMVSNLRAALAPPPLPGQAVQRAQLEVGGPPRMVVL